MSAGSSDCIMIVIQVKNNISTVSTLPVKRRIICFGCVFFYAAGD